MRVHSLGSFARTRNFFIGTWHGARSFEPMCAPAFSLTPARSLSQRDKDRAGGRRGRGCVGVCVRVYIYTREEKGEGIIASGINHRRLELLTYWIKAFFLSLFIPRQRTISVDVYTEQKTRQKSLLEKIASRETEMRCRLLTLTKNIRKNKWISLCDRNYLFSYARIRSKVSL